VAQAFRWSPAKDRTNLKKHGISFAEAATIFADLLSVTIDDPIHSHEERRLITIGISFRNHLLVSHRGGKLD